MVRRRKKMGSPTPERGAKAAAVVRASLADRRAQTLRPVIEGLQAAGHTSTAQIAAQLNELGIRSPQGRYWHRESVRRLLIRIQKLE